jgi:putative ATPase
MAGGDARRALNTLENATNDRPEGFVIDIAAIEEELEAGPVNYSREKHYDITSAFCKSMRGGDADATLYWLSALLQAGEDPKYIARRIMVHASEDVGLADNTALQTAVAAAEAVERIGMPEARIPLAHAALHVCRSPKSNSVLRGLSLAGEHIRKNNIAPVPNHLRDTHYEGAAPQGRGGYKSPHSSPEGWLAQEYAPGIALGQFYQSDDRTGTTFEGRSDAFWEHVRGTASPRKWKQG